MGSKGTSTNTTQNQTSTYAPTQQAQGYITDAMGMAQSAASNPFAIPQAPVAGFSQDQTQAFQQFRDAQGSAQPYYNQASNYFSPQGTQDFLNPYAANVMAGMKDVFGSQQSQLNSNLVGAAGGVGADRIGVGQAELAKQQDLSAGQTLSGLYQNAAQQAQAAGQGQMALGQNVQNSQLQGANALLGVGGLQQQLSQAQMNSPYQQQLAQAAFPYQQAQFLAGITGALAPGLGGTTSAYGTGSSTPPAPSVWSQLLGAGTAAAGIYGGFNSGSGSKGSGTGDGSWYGQSSVGGKPLGQARGGRINPYAEGGAVSDDPIDISQHSIIPTMQLQPIQAHIPQANLNLNPPQQKSDSGGGLGDIAKIASSVGSMAAMFSDERLKENVQSVGKTHDGQNIYSYNFKGSPQTQMGLLAQEVEQRHPEAVGESGGYKTVDYDEATKGSHRADGGRVDPYAPLTGYDDGGPVDVFGDDNRARGYDLLRQGVGTRAPDSIPGGEPAPVVNPDEPYRLAGPAAMDAWRNDTPIIAGGENPGGAPPRATAMAFAGPDAEPESPAVGAITSAYGPPGSSGLKRAVNPSQDVSPYSQPSAAELGAPPRREAKFIDSPWAALMSAGLGMMGGTSPYAGVNIGQGGMQGMKTLQVQRENSQKDETTDQASRRLAQEAKFHNDQYTKMTPYQKGTLEQQKAALDAEKYVNAGSIMTKDGLHPAVMDTKSGKIVDGITGQPPTPSDTVIAKGASRNSPEEISGVVDGIISGSQPPTLTGLYGDSIHVRSGLQKAGFNLAKAQQEWKNAERLGASVNSSRMVSYVGLNGAVDKTIDRVKELSEQIKLSGIPLMNKLQLAAAMKTRGNSPEGQLATQYMTAVNTLKEEFANLANGGYAPTEPAWKLANDQVNGEFGVKQLGASLDEIQRVIRYRIQSVPGLATLGPNSTNRYSGTGGPPPAHGAPAGGTPPPAAGGAAAPPPAGGGGMKPSPDGKGPLEAAKRFGELHGLGGKTEDEIFAILGDEGYHQ